MVFLGQLKDRRCRPEIMDEPGLDPTRHMHALRGLARINRLSASDRILWRPLAALAREQPGRALRVLDVATGGGDVAVRLWRRAARAGLKLEMHGADLSATALEFARKKAQEAGAEVEFFQLDVRRQPVPAGFDVLVCSLFLHHLGEEQAAAFLRALREAAGRMVLINDLRRCRLGFLLAWLGARALTTSEVVRVDAPRSVQAAFRLQEVRALADGAGMRSAAISRRWPCRFLLNWRRP
jgi:2-polyprenyl-3-methyl-5-hydroxy-6-metoxy-1,4-benzoquinol methylase